MKTAIIHEWLVTQAGAESVLESIYKLFPGTIHTLFHDPDGLVGTQWENVEVTASMLQRLPFGKKRHRMFLPLYPMAIEQFDLRDYKLVDVRRQFAIVPQEPGLGCELDLEAVERYAVA